MQHHSRCGSKQNMMVQRMELSQDHLWKPQVWICLLMTVVTKTCGLIQIKPRPIVCWTRPLCATIFNLLTHPALLSILKPLSSLFLKRLLSLSLFQSVPWKQLSRNFQAFPHHRCCWFLTEGSDRVLRTPALVLHSHGRESLKIWVWV